MVVFRQTDTRPSPVALTTEDELRDVLLNREFVVHYQPIVLLADSTAIGHEALVKWNHPTRGLLSPVEFLAIAEESGLIVELGEQVPEQVCELVAERPDLPGPVSINHLDVKDPEFVRLRELGVGIYRVHPPPQR